MIKQSPFWLTLLNYWCANRTGLTLPFIVGADAIQREAEVSPTDTRRLFNEIYLNGGVELIICPDIKVPILAISRSYPAAFRVHLDNTWGESDGEKLENFVTNAEHLVNAGRFSRTRYYQDTRWDKFQEEDLDFINSAIRSYVSGHDA